MCRVHELEADKMGLQSERLVRQHELKRRDLIILRYDRQRQLCEEIITRQRQIIEGKFLNTVETQTLDSHFYVDGRLKLPSELQELYQLYQQEIHAATFTDFGLSPSAFGSTKLPPINKE